MPLTIAFAPGLAICPVASAMPTGSTAGSAGDLLMVMVLRRLNGSSLLGEYANLAAYVARGEARPPFKRAFAAQREVFKGINSKPKHGPAK